MDKGLRDVKDFNPAALAEFRWFANAIENAAIVVYSGNRSSYERLHECLSRALGCVSTLKADYPHLEVECPWPLQPDGECKPCSEE